MNPPIAKILKHFPSLAICFCMCYVQFYILNPPVFKSSHLEAYRRVELAFLLMLLQY